MHPKNLKSYDQLAANLEYQDRYEEAELLLRNSLEIRQNTHGDMHIDTALSYYLLANNLDAQGRHKEAEPLFRKAIKLTESFWNDDHPILKDMKDNFRQFLKNH